MFLTRVRDCLEDDYPLLIEVLNEEERLQLFERYIVEHPSRFQSLEHLSQDVPKFSRRHFGEKPFLEDIVNFESTLSAIRIAERKEGWYSANLNQGLDVWLHKNLRLSSTHRLLGFLVATLLMFGNL